MFRGVDHTAPMILTNPLLSKRESANSQNYYTILTSMLQSWEDWPNRDQSIVCSTNFYRARDYGQTYVVFPIDNPNIAVGSDMDFWYCFQKLCDHFKVEDLNDFNNLIDMTLGRITYENANIKLKHFEDQILSDPDNNKPNLKFIEINNSVFDTLSYYFDPKINGNTLAPLSKINKKINAREVWVSAPCYLVTTDLFKI